jgi:threonine synthase
MPARRADGRDTPPDLRKNYETVALSIGATRGTYQALDIVRRSGGTALTIGNDEMMRWQRTLASDEGLFVEPSSAAGLAAVEQLASSGRLGGHHTVVSLLTASGLKDPTTTASLQNDLLAVPVDFNDALAVLKSADIFPH